MKTFLLTTVGIVTLTSLSAWATSYTDATGDFSPSFGNDGLDIASVDVNNDATTLNFTITTVGAPNLQTWYNFLAGISKPSLSGGGNANATGGWGTDIQMSSGGMDYFIGAYPGFSGYDLKTWDGVSVWTTTFGVASANSSQVTFSVALSSLGLSAGDTFQFDVWTQSGGNSVLDALSDTTVRSFQNNPFDTGANALSYTVVGVPEPSAVVLLGLGGLLALRRAVRRE